MNPITINIKVGLEDTTLEILTALVTAAARTGVTTSEQKTADVEQKAVTVEQKPAKKEQKAAKVEQAAAVQEPAAKAAEEPIEDMPAEIAPVTDTELRAVVTETRQRVGSATPIRAMMLEKYGIKVSTECPQERRAEFINDLKAL